MPAALLALLPAAVLLLAAPAAAQDADNPADTGFPIALLVIAVAAVVLALVWRAVSKRKQDSDQ